MSGVLLVTLAIIITSLSISLSPDFCLRDLPARKGTLGGCITESPLYPAKQNYLKGVEEINTMFGFSIRTRQSGGTDSPRTAAASPTTSIGSPRIKTSVGSPRVEVGEIDTRAPFQSVKAAVSLFGDVTSPKTTKPVLKKPKIAEERVLEKETQLHLALKELNKFKEQLKSTESTKAQAQRELERANRTLQELTRKLETASESKQAAFAATEAAKNRAIQLEEMVKSSKTQLDGHSWKQDVDSQRELYRASAAELNVAKQELASIRQDFDAVLEIKLTAFQEAADAQHATKVNTQRLNELSKEILTMRETLTQVKLATFQAQEEHAKAMADREACLQSHRTNKEAVESKILLLKEEESDLKLSGNLEEKLEETTGAISVIQEQLKNMRESDLQSLRTVTLELEEANNALQAIMQEESLLRASVDSLKLELDEVKRELSQLMEKEAQSKSATENMRAEIDSVKLELEAAVAEDKKQRDASEDTRLLIQQLSSEMETAIREAKEMREKSRELQQEAETAQNEAKETEEKLEVALKEVEEAKAAAKMASDQIHATKNNNNKLSTDANATNSEDSLVSSSPSRDKIKLSFEDFESLSKKVEEFENAGQAKVEAATAEAEASNARERELVQKLEATLKEIEEIKAATEEALKKVEMDEAAKLAVEGELYKWRHQEENN